MCDIGSEMPALKAQLLDEFVGFFLRISQIITHGRTR
jgi:hypothetical protein